MVYGFLNRNLRREECRHTHDAGRDGIHRHPRGLAATRVHADAFRNNQQIAEPRADVMDSILVFLASLSAIALACDIDRNRVRN